uniref:Uncharacterized protein n=1 Tax=Pseudo-nitzschia australis TaxID=44445 RepID=A0A7S4ANB6_9STRA
MSSIHHAFAAPKGVDKLPHSNQSMTMSASASASVPGTRFVSFRFVWMHYCPTTLSMELQRVQNNSVRGSFRFVSFRPCCRRVGYSPSSRVSNASFRAIQDNPTHHRTKGRTGVLPIEHQK